jgi:hypothetical protein
MWLSRLICEVSDLLRNALFSAEYVVGGGLCAACPRPGFLQARAVSSIGMDENRARRVVDALRDRGVPAHVAMSGGYAHYGVRVVLPDEREALWDTDGTAGLEAQVLRDGMLVGFVPHIEGSEEFTEEQVVDAIARTDYDQPVARQRREAPPPAAPLPMEGGFFRRFRDGFRGN